MLVAVKYAIAQHNVTSLCFLHLHFKPFCFHGSRSLTFSKRKENTTSNNGHLSITGKQCHDSDLFSASL